MSGIIEVTCESMGCNNKVRQGLVVCRDCIQAIDNFKKHMKGEEQ